MFLIRLEIHNATDYEPLHREMANRGMVRFIKAGNAQIYRLPNGTYQYRGTGKDATQLSQDARLAAIEAGHYKSSVIVAEVNSVTWAGLEYADIHEQIAYAAVA